jgi:aspartyl-tRNA(Asn)/glutamyl-tRNA(Gln) amidotransferase subunit A
MNCSNLLVSEAYQANRSLLEEPARAGLLGSAVRERLLSGREVSSEQLIQARQFQRFFASLIAEHLDHVELLALPSVAMFAPTIADAALTTYNRLTSPINLVGLPALAIPVPSESAFPASLQLVGAANSEELLLTTGALIEASVAI